MKYKKVKNFLLTVDGKSSSGKSTAAKLLSKKFSIPHLSSGLLYRWAAKKILNKKNISRSRKSRSKSRPRRSKSRKSKSAPKCRMVCSRS